MYVSRFVLLCHCFAVETSSDLLRLTPDQNHRLLDLQYTIISVCHNLSYKNMASSFHWMNTQEIQKSLNFLEV